jgi:elongation factor P
MMHKGVLHVVVDIQHVAKGNWRSYYQIKARNLATGQLLDERFRVDDEVDIAFLERKKMEYLYSDPTGHVLMDLESFDQVAISDEVMADGKKYLKPNTEVEVTVHDGKILSVELPNTVDLKIVDTPPALKGATATNQSKDAELETGAHVKVPPFIETGEVVRVDTRTGEYLGRATAE